MSGWNPKRTIPEADAILCAPGTLHEMETRLIDGRLLRTYKNLWPSLRAFWLLYAKKHQDAVYVVYEKQRITYKQVFERSVRAAAMFRNVYNVCKGDRVCICSRNYPDFIVAFWACHLIGAVSVLANAWLPSEVLQHCIVHVEPKLVILDLERADCLEPSVSKLASDVGTIGILVLEAHESKRRWNGMQAWETALQNFKGDSQSILADDPGITAEDNASILFTSGTTGLPKGVLSTQRQWLTNAANVLVGSRRAILRRGEDIPPTPIQGPQKSSLVSVPLFHVAGATSRVMMSTMGGYKMVLMRKWDVQEAIRLIKEENISIAGGVPSMVSDLADSALAGYPLEGLVFGGAPAHDTLPARAHKAFPAAVMGQVYGSTETNAVAVAVSGEDYVTRTASCGLPTPVNDIIIMDGDKQAPLNTVGEVWIRGPNVMKEYWRDPVATEKVLTKDGWLKMGDLGFMDDEGFLYIRDRIKDIIIRGGENIASISVENAIYTDPHVAEVAVVGIPDKRLGEQVAAIVSVRPENRAQVTEESLIALARNRLPRFAVPAMVIVQETPFEQNASGKVIKAELRKLAHSEWQKRQLKHIPNKL